MKPKVSIPTGRYKLENGVLKREMILPTGERVYAISIDCGENANWLQKLREERKKKVEKVEK